MINFCTSADVQNYLSVSGVNLRTDDAATSALLQDCLDEAATDVLFYTQLAYDPNTLAASSNWINKKSRILAAYYLCTRRNNPAAKFLEKRREQVIDDFKMVQNGSITIPDAPQRKECVPVLSNMRVAQAPLNRVVTDPSRSTGTPSGYQQSKPLVDPGDLIPLDFNI